MKNCCILLLSLLFIFSETVCSQTVITAGNDTTICLGGTAHLSGTVTSGSYGTTSYTFEVYNYSPEPFTGGTPVQFDANQDDRIAGPFDIGFSFCFFNTTYTQFYIGSNGWVGFTYNAAWTTFTAQPIPSTNDAVPKNCIMAPWQDWWPGWTPGGTNGTNVYYYTTGTAPNRKLVVYWVNCPLYNCTSDLTKYGTFQIVLNEQNSIVENHIQKKPNCSAAENATQGVHNSDGTVAFTAVGRNCTPWTANNESTRFVPSGIIWYTGGYPGGTIVGYGPTLIVSPTTTTVYTVAVESCTGGTATDDVTVFVVDATFNYPQSTYCSSDPDPTPSLLQNGGSFSATPPGLVFADNVLGIIDLSASAAGTYVVTRTINTPCTVSYSQTITVNPTPAVPVPVDDSVFRCGPGSVTMSVVPNAGEQYTWYDSPTGGTKIGMGISLTTNVTVTDTFYVESQTLATSCKSLSRAMVVAVVKPIPIVSNTVTAFSQCSGATTNIVLTADQPGSTFTWTATPSSGNVSGFAAGSGGTIMQTLANAGFSNETVTYSVTPTFNGCTGPAQDLTVTVYPVPDVSNTPLFQQICQGQSTNITLTSHVTGALFTWTCTQSSGQVTGWSPNPGPPANLLNQTLLLNVFVKDSVIYHITPVANGCTGPVSDFIVRVNPVPALITNPLIDSICSGNTTNIWLQATCAGVVFNWTAAIGTGNVTGFSNGTGDHIIQTLTNTLTITGSVIYSITPSTGTCTGNDTSFTELVKPTPHVTTTPLNTSLCNNTPLSIGFTSDIAGTLYSWTCTPSSASITGWSDSPSPVATLNQTLLNTGNNTETVTYHVTPDFNGCQGPVVDYVVTVYPTATLTNVPLAQSQCDGLNTNLTLTSNVAGTLFTWTCTPSSGNITGWANSIAPGTTINQVLDNTGYDTEWATYHVAPTNNGCPGPVADYVVTVYPTPDLSNTPASKSQCDNLNTNILLTSNVSGTLFTWTCTPSSGNITGYSNSTVPGVNINQVLDNTGYNTEWATYHVAPTSNGCPGPVTDFVVTVYPTPNLSNTPLTVTLCDDATLNVNLTSNVTGTLFTWTCTPSSGNITGWSDNSVPTTLLNQVLNNTGLNSENVVYHMLPAANGCLGLVTDYTVLVGQTPDVFFSPTSQIICSLQATGINILSSVPGAVFTWTASGSSGNVTGFSPGSGISIIQTLTNTGSSTETVTYHVTPSAIGCPPGITQDVVVTVNPRPAINNPVTTFQICSGASTNIVPTSTVPNSTFAWTASGSSGNVTGFSNGAGPNIIQSLTNSGFNTEAVTYQVTPTANGCPGTASPFVVTVFPVANVVFTPNGQSFCSGGTSAINLTSGVTGASFTWTATGSAPTLTGFGPGSGTLVQQTLFNSGTGPGSVTYSVTPTANGCTGTLNSVVVTVNPLPSVSFTACWDPVMTTGSQPILLRTGIPSGGTYSGTGVLGNTFSPASAGPGLHTITYSYSNTWTCTGQATATINVVAPTPFACGNILTDPRDSKTYPTVQIGGQCWMSGNLDYGNTIPSALMQADNCVTEKYCFGDNSANCTSNGALYQWDELMKYTAVNGAQGLCPPEWHIPTEAEWSTLFSFYISNGFAGSPLKYTGYSGFNAFLSGVRFNDVQWDFSNFAIMFWSSASHGPRKAWAHGMNSFIPSVSYYPSHRNNAFPVRCIKD